jgi:hypothetical protein
MLQRFFDSGLRFATVLVVCDAEAQAGPGIVSIETLGAGTSFLRKRAFKQQLHFQRGRCAYSLMSSLTFLLQESKEQKKPLKPKGHTNKWLGKKWTDVYSWLLYDDTTKAVTCKTCIAASADNSFTGDGSKSIRIDTIKTHGESTSHLDSVKALADAGKPADASASSSSTASSSSSASTSATAADVKQPSAWSFFQKLQSEAKETLIKRLQIVYYLAKQKRPLSDFKAQLELQDMLGTPGLDLNSAFPSHVKYDSATFVAEALSAISEYLWQQQLQVLQQSPTLSIYLDESTDIANCSEMILCLGGVLNGEPFTAFADILQLQAGNSTHLTSKLLEWFNSSGIDLSTLGALGSDGAPTITGSKDGAARFVVCSSRNSCDCAS